MSNLSSLEIFEKQTAIAFVHNAWARRKGNTVRTEFVWDPTEPVATRPLIMRAKNWGLNLFYTHDGNKNVSEVFYHAPQNGIAAHYDYAPFGAVTRTSSATRVTNRDLISENPFRFSSEYHDAPTSLVYYNYRHYNPADGRWTTLDPIGAVHDETYLFLENNANAYSDFLGLLATKNIKSAKEIGWPDFQGPIPEGASRDLGAETVVMTPKMDFNPQNVVYESVGRNEKGECCVQARLRNDEVEFRFVTSKSWVRPDTIKNDFDENNLNHERTHVNIYLHAYRSAKPPSVEPGCASTCKEAKKIARENLKNAYTKWINAIFAQQDGQQRQFDSETYHGMWHEKELEWRKKVQP